MTESFQNRNHMLGATWQLIYSPSFPTSCQWVHGVAYPRSATLAEDGSFLPTSPLNRENDARRQGARLIGRVFSPSQGLTQDFW